MKFIQTEQIELTTEEVRALDIIRRLGEHICGFAKDEKHRAKGSAIYLACAALDFVHSTEIEDPDDVMLRRKDLWHANEGDWSIEDLKNHLPDECADLIDRAIEDACDKAREEGYQVGYDKGYTDKEDEVEDW